MNFNEKILKIQAFATKEEKQSIHFKSMRNFIEYHHQIKKEKKKIDELLEECFSIIESSNCQLSREESRVFFNQYISRLGSEYYSKHLDFTNHLGNFLLALIFLAANFLTWLIFKSSTAVSISLFVSLCMVTNYFFKMAKHKMYGYRY